MNTEKNKEKWLQKICDTMKFGGRSNRTFENYKSHIKRFLDNYDEKTNIKNLKKKILFYI